MISEIVFLGTITVNILSIIGTVFYVGKKMGVIDTYLKEFQRRISIIEEDVKILIRRK